MVGEDVPVGDADPLAVTDDGVAIGVLPDEYPVVVDTRGCLDVGAGHLVGDDGDVDSVDTDGAGHRSLRFSCGHEVQTDAGGLRRGSVLGWVFTMVWLRSRSG